MTKYTQWQKSWDKWSGDLWGRLEKKLVEMESEDYLFDEVYYRYIREKVFQFLLWNPCAYCDKYMVLDKCSGCPLKEMGACNPSLNVYALTSRMYHAWLTSDREMFEKHQQEFLKALKETKFPDEEEE